MRQKKQTEENCKILELENPKKKKNLGRSVLNIDPKFQTIEYASPQAEAELIQKYANRYTLLHPSSSLYTPAFIPLKKKERRKKKTHTLALVLISNQQHATL